VGTADSLNLQPLSARSIVLSLLLGAHPPQRHVRHLLGSAELFGVSESALRVALTRMTSAGELERDNGVYRLNARLLERQRRQDESINAQTVPWSGDWEQAIVVVSGRAAADRAQLRSDLTALRLSELREGVWMRPANLEREWPRELEPSLTRFTARPTSPASELVAALWDLPGWSATGEALLKHFSGTTDPLTRLTAAAAIVHHLTTDPVLPDELLPADWPGARLRETYAAYQAELIALTESFVG
jgi:phenylacetic acid degradation operon negative regulatory protein